jgi:hypothetical protein
MISLIFATGFCPGSWSTGNTCATRTIPWQSFQAPSRVRKDFGRR